LPFIHSFEIDSPLSIAPITVIADYEWKPQRFEKYRVCNHLCPTPPIVEDKGNPTIRPLTSHK